MRRRDFLIGAGLSAAAVTVPALGVARASSVDVRVDRAAHTVTRRDGRRVVWTVGGRGQAVGRFEHPEAAVVDTLGQVWVADRGNHRIVVLADDGTVVTCITEAAGASLSSVRGLAVDARGRVWAADPGNHRLLRFEAPSRAVAFGVASAPGARDGLNYPTGVAVDARDRVHVADTGHGRIAVFDADGALATTYGDDALRLPRRVVIDGWRTARATDLDRVVALRTA